VLSMHDESLHAERALRAGARGYVTKQEATQTIMAAIRTVLSGEIYISQKMSKQLLGQLLEKPESPAAAAPVRLTNREADIFQLLAQDYTTRQIGELLKIDIKTVETYYVRLREKFGVQSVEQLRQRATPAPGKNL